MFAIKDENIRAQPKVGRHQVLSLLFPCCARLFSNINSDLCLTSEMFTCCLSHSFYLFTGGFFVYTVIPYMAPVLQSDPVGV